MLVTGGASGIGLATVRRLAGAGHRVFAASRRPDRAEFPPGVTPLVLDLASADSAASAIDAVVGAASGLDVLVNNAGTSIVGAFEDIDDKDAHRLFEVNLFGPIRLARLAVPVMRRQGHGRIINVTSMNDVLPAPFGGWYSASKAALASASVVLGAEVRQFGIRVSVVAPGFFHTPMAVELTEAPVPPESAYRRVLGTLREQNESRLETAGDPDEVAAAIEQCISSADPPARVVVGRDAISFDKLVRESSPDDFAHMIQEFVAQLAGS